jgi:Concanavalin A-like lectin/glucanases superfamily/K319L-like, PKD domain/Bacterial Ig domain
MNINMKHNLTPLITLPIFAVLSIVLFSNFGAVYSENPDVSYLDVNDTSSVSKFTVAAWFKTSNDFKSNAYIVNKDGDGGNMNYGLWMTSSEKVEGGFENSNGKAMYATSPISYSDGNWHYAMVTFDGSIINLYVDGIQVATKSASGSPDNGGNEPVRVGANSEKPDNYFIGDVDEIRVWKTALSPFEAANSYNGKFDTDGQILYLDFSDPILTSNNTAQINATSLNATSINSTDFQEFNNTLINETDISGINATLNTTNKLVDLVTNNKTGNATGTEGNATGTEGTEGNATGTEGNATGTEGNATGTEGNVTGTEGNATGTEGNATGTEPIIRPIEPQNTNDTGSVEEPTENQTSTPIEVNNSPEAFDQSVSVDEDVQVDITLRATDEDNDPVKFDITTDPTQGALTKFDGEKGTATYAPQEGYSGSDQFRFRAIDDKGSESNVAQVDITVEESQSNETQTSDLSETEQDTTNETSTERSTGTGALEQTNQPPNANGGNDLSVDVNTQVKLDGGQSTDEDGQIVSYKWEQTGGPEINLEQPNEQTASFDVPESAADSKLTFKLTVVDDKEASDSDEVSVEVKSAVTETETDTTEQQTETDTTEQQTETDTTEQQTETDTTEQQTETDTTEQQTETQQVEEENVRPKADAGGDKNAEVNTEVKLEGGQSSDEDGEIVSYKWEQSDGPEVDLKNADGKTASFDVPESAADSKLTFKLTVVDDKDASDSDDASVEVQAAPQESSEESDEESTANGNSNAKGKSD